MKRIYELWNKSYDGKFQTTAVVTNTLIRNVYIWMCTALLLTGATVSFIVQMPSAVETIISNKSCSGAC